MTTQENSQNRIWIDADACPGQVKEVVYKASLRTKTPVVMVANQFMQVSKSKLVSFVKVDAGADVADAYIKDHALSGDIVVTADVPLAADLVEKGCSVVTPSGKTFDSSNVTEALSVRNFMQDLRDSGVQTGGPPGFSTKQKQNFANALDRLLTKMIRQ